MFKGFQGSARHFSGRTLAREAIRFYWRRMSFKTLVFVSMAMLAFVSIAEGAAFKLRPFLAVVEEYNDNMLLTKENRVDDFITRVQPSFNLEYKAPAWEWDISYQLDYRYFAERTRSDETTHDLGARGRINVLRDVFFIDIRDDFERVTLDVTRDFTRESLIVNQSDRNIFVLNPNLVLRLAPTVYVKPGYIYGSIWYEDERGIDKTNNAAYVSISKEMSEKTTFSLGYSYTREDTDFRDFEKNDVFAGSRHEYAENSYFFFTVGNAWLDVEGGGPFSQFFWDTGLSHAFAALKATIKSSRTYDENPTGNSIRVNKYEASLGEDLERASFNVSASFRDYRDTVTDALQARGYGAWGSVKYDLSSRTAGSLNFYGEKIERKQSRSDPKRYSATVRLDYMFFRDVLFAVSYQHAKSESEVDLDDYEVNRVSVEVKKTF